MKKIKQYLYNELVVQVKNALHIWREKRALRKAIKYADFLSEMHNERKYVVLKNYKGDFQAICRDDFKLFRLPRRGRFDKRTTWQDILRDCNYQTPTKS